MTTSDREGFDVKRIAKFAKSLDGRWIFLLADDHDDEDNWHFLDEFLDRQLKEERQRTLKLAIETVEKLRKNRDAQIHGPNDEPVDLGGLEPGYVAMFNEGISAALAALTAIEKDGI